MTKYKLSWMEFSGRYMLTTLTAFYLSMSHIHISFKIIIKMDLNTKNKGLTYMGELIGTAILVTAYSLGI